MTVSPSSSITMNWSSRGFSGWKQLFRTSASFAFGREPTLSERFRRAGIVQISSSITLSLVVVDVDVRAQSAGSNESPHRPNADLVIPSVSCPFLVQGDSDDLDLAPVRASVDEGS